MKKNVFFISLGCDKNLVDSEHMLGILDQSGFQITDDETAADVIVINTCCFINDAKEESIQSILEMAPLRTQGSCRALIVTGCLAQRYQDEILKEIPEVDAVIGTMSYEQLPEVISRVLSGEQVVVLDDISRPLTGRGKEKRLLSTGGHYAYLKIAEGCSKRCSYCVIPSVRGSYRSVPMEDLLREAAELAAQGVKELILVAQETTLYGTDLYGRKSLHLLIRKLAAIENIRWIRVMYCYPEEVYAELIDVMRSEPKFCHYLDLPIQHADNDILRRMGRKTTREDLTALIASLREEIPDIVLRTTLLTGFPGETPRQHETLLEFVDEMEFDRLGVFAYSPEEGTKAADMPDQIPEDVKESRKNELLALQQEIAFMHAQENEGRILTVMTEGKVADEDVYICRTYADAPDVDGYLFLHTDEVLCSGDFVKVKVTGAHEYDLIGEPVDV